LGPDGLLHYTDAGHVTENKSEFCIDENYESSGKNNGGKDYYVSDYSNEDSNGNVECLITPLEMLLLIIDYP